MRTIHTLLCTALLALPIALHGQTTVSYTSKADGSQMLQQVNGKTSSSAGTANVITIKPSNGSYQTMDGFGYALTYSSCYNLLKMRASDRTRLLTRLYSPTKGYGVSYARISIGCNDFSSTEYTLCDTKGSDDNLLSHFGLHSDEINYVIPVLKEILAINPDLKIMAAPWTCPRWMKVNDLESRKSKNSWTDGHLNPDYRDTYADYFVKFIETMKAQGINIYAVTPQNEPLNKANCASLYMPWDEEAPFVKSLAKAFHNNDIKTRIYVFDHNFNYDKKSDQNDYPIKVYNALGTGYPGEDLVVGAAYHDYGGDPSEMGDIHKQNTDKEVIFTEESIGTWNGGHDLAGTLVSSMKRSGIKFMQNWARAVMVWNLMLDDHLGPNLDGGCQTCYGAIDINSSNYSSLSYNNHYFLINHLSSVIKPGAQRVATTGWWANDMDYLAFKNTDGTYAMIFASSNSKDQKFTITDGNGKYMDVTVPSNSVVSVRFGNFTPSVISDDVDMPTLNGEKFQDTDDGYAWFGNLTQGQKLVFDGAEEFKDTDWYMNPDFFEKNGNGYKFLAISGRYEILADYNLKFFQVFQVNDDNTPMNYDKTTGKGNVWVIGDNGIGKPSFTTNPTKWWTGIKRDIPMAKINDTQYRLTVNAGKEIRLKDSYINFKFFGQADWGTEFNTDPEIVLGEGMSDYFSTKTGNIYFYKNNKDMTDAEKAEIQKISKLVFILDVSNPKKAVLYSNLSPSIITAVKNVSAYKKGNDTFWYTVDGISLKQKPQQPGIYIHEGKKFIVK